MPTIGTPLQGYYYDQPTDTLRPLTSPGSIPVFADVATRDAQWPAPPNGATCVTLSPFTVWVRKAGVWQPPPGTVVYTGSTTSGQVNFTSLGLRDLVALSRPGVPYPTISVANVVTYFGFAGANVSASCDLFRYSDNVASLNGGEQASVQAARWIAVPVNWQWPVAANLDSGLKSRINITSFGGGTACWVQSDIVLTVTAA